MIYITKIHMSGGTKHEHIAKVMWKNLSNQNAGESTRAEMVRWITEKDGDARVADGKNDVKVGVVKASPPYLRTYADGKWTDNLLALPRY